MKHSEQLNEIAKAMSKLQNEIRDAEKDTQGYGYKYADLGQVLSLIRPLLEKNGLSFSQHVENTAENVTIETITMHESGQWMSSFITMPIVPEAKRSVLQCIGTSITYGRRYALTSIFGITQVAEDKDGHVEEPKHKQYISTPAATNPIPSVSEYIVNKVAEYYERNDMLGAVDCWKSLSANEREAVKPRLSKECSAWYQQVLKNAPKAKPTAVDYASV